MNADSTWVEDSSGEETAATHFLVITSMIAITARFAGVKWVNS